MKTRVLTRITYSVTASALTLIVAGMFLGNMLLIFLGILPLVTVLLGLIIDQPKNVEIEPPENTLNVWVNDEIKISRTVKVTGGLGPLTIGERIPNYFSLVEGNNFMVMWKGFNDQTFQLSYVIKCTRRGIYELDELVWETKHILGLTPTKEGISAINQQLIVRPNPFNIKRIRQQKVFSRFTMPSEAQIKMGIPTTDFREIRDYSFGDSYRHINWKATARGASSFKLPKVNSYEMEGMKVVWIFLNTSTQMALGTNIQNSFEYAIQAVLGFSQFYLSRNCRVGFSFYDDSRSTVLPLRKRPRGSSQSIPFVLPDLLSSSSRDALSYLDESSYEATDFLIPDMGKRQLILINNKILEADISSGNYNMKQSIIRCRRHILGTNPLFIIITTIEKSNIQQMKEGLQELSKYIRRSRTGNFSILILHIAGFDVAARNDNERMASELLELEAEILLRQIGGVGISRIHWSPKTQSFSDVLLSQVKRR